MDITRPVTLNATFLCVGQGYGFVNVSWFGGSRGSENSPPGKSIITTMITPYNITSILTLPDLTDRDEGRYRCRYNNSGGKTDSELARLTIASKF